VAPCRRGGRQTAEEGPSARLGWLSPIEIEEMEMATFEQRLQRLSLRIRELELWRDRLTLGLSGWTLDGQPLPVGGGWPRADGAVRLENQSVRVPPDWPLEATRLELAAGGEGLLHIDYGEGLTDTFGLDAWHRRMPLRAPSFSLSAEVVARLPFGRPNPAPRLEVARLVWVDGLVDSLCRRLRLAMEAAATLVGTEAAELLLRAAEQAMAEIELPSETQEYLGRMAGAPEFRALWSWTPRPARPLSDRARASLGRAVALLGEELARIRVAHPPRGRLALAGQAHLDLAWLWPLEETVRKARRTFWNACQLLERYPEATFTQSSAELYQLVKEADPELFERVRRWVGEGRWEPVGGMWVEADLNMTSGESLVRQLLYGQRWFKAEFGAAHSVGWLPDCFGFNAALPQLLRGAGIESLFTAKLNWSETNQFPYDLWWWEGIDGSRVLAHSFQNREGRPEGLGSYNGDPSPQVLVWVWDAFRGRVHHPESLFTIGYGDGGGGLNEEMLEDIRALSGFPALPELSFTRLDDFYRRLHQAAAGCDLPVWVGEMYLELHRGTYTTQGRIKRLHRQAERDLVAAEVVYGVARLLGVEGSAPDLARAWRLLLRNQFHDILPGSGIREVAEQAERELAEVVATAGAAIDANLGRLAATLADGEGTGVLVVNPDLSPRPLQAVLPSPLSGAQRVDEGWAVSGSQLAGLEVAVLPEVDIPGPAERARAVGRVLENGLVRAEIAADGSLASVVDLRRNREVLAGPGNQLWARSDRPRAWEAWDVDEDARMKGERIGPPESIEVVEEGPHRAGIRLRWRWRSSRLTQVIRLWAGSPRIEFVTDIDWHERRVLLEANFPLAVRAPRATFETAFGVVERPTHRNTSWDQARFEVPAHRFADVSEPGFGVALLNDGRYGHHVLGGELGITLLRSPVHPDPLADEGEHRFTYALLPHPGSWLEGGVLAEAEDLNRPLLVQACPAQRARQWRALAVEGLPVGLAALKPAEDAEALVLRLYEPQGARGTISVSVPPGWRLETELDLLEAALGPPDLGFGPFQVRTYLVEPERSAARDE
jgi:alpha-mannosidase